MVVDSGDRTAFAAAFTGPDQIDVAFHRTAPEGLWYMRLQNSAYDRYGIWQNIAYAQSSTPAMYYGGYYGGSGLQIYFKGEGNRIWRTRPETGFTLEDLGGPPADSSPAVTGGFGRDRIDLFAKSQDGRLLHGWQQGASAWTWEVLNTSLSSAPTVWVNPGIPETPFVIDVLFRGPEQTLRFFRWQDGWASQSAEVRPPAAEGEPPRLASAPSAVENSMDYSVFALGEDGRLWRAWYQAGTFSFHYQPYSASVRAIPAVARVDGTSFFTLAPVDDVTLTWGYWRSSQPVLPPGSWTRLAFWPGRSEFDELLAAGRAQTNQCLFPSDCNGNRCLPDGRCAP